MGLMKTMKQGESLTIKDDGGSSIQIVVEEFTQGSEAKKVGDLIKVRLRVSADQKWKFFHFSKNGELLKGGNDANNRREGKEAQSSDVVPNSEPHKEAYKKQGFGKVHG